ncbi:MAG: ribonuclease R [Chitinophagaceae bacterium]|nr:ribonuclease R [Chitinophagaceae bacterium]
MSSKKPSKRKHSKSDKRGEFTGTLDITRSGMGFVIVPGVSTDIMVRPSDFNTALHGDTVKVVVKGDSSKKGRQQGEVTEVIKRRQTEFPGRLQLSENFAFFIADIDKPMPDIFIPLDKTKNATEQDMVIVRIVEWHRNKKPVGEVVNVMDESDESDFAMKQILMENGFPLNFSDEALEESERIPEIISAEEIGRRKDMRGIFTVTIDPIDAKDFDDAISLRKLGNGNYEVGVHIADVSYYLEPGTVLDTEAFERATSVYLPDRVLPMLPERISNELCSLRPKEDKLTFSSIFEMTPKGVIKSQWIGRTVINSNHRFTYEEVQEIIETGEGLYKEDILFLNNLSQKFRKQRFKKGAINFSSQEVRFKLDEKAKPIGIIIKESKEAHQLIEELMLLANRTVAEYVSKIKVDKKPVPFPYRVHDTPDEIKLLPFVAFAKKYGHDFDTSTPEGIAASFNNMLEAAKGTPQQHVLEQLGIRTMAKAIYTTENIGHYGLGFQNYCHFTSPIRRYPDVIVHRILQQCLDHKIVPDKKLEQKCKHSSDRERSAMEAERAANKYKQVEYMREFLGEEFEGVITGVAGFGFWVETTEHKCEGLVSLNSLLEFDDFALIEGDYSLVGRRSGKQFRMGDKVSIKVVAANLTKRQLDYEWLVTAAMADKQEPKTETKKKAFKKQGRKNKRNK